MASPVSNKTSCAIHQYLPNASRLIFGCMGLGGDWHSQNYCQTDIKHAHQAVDNALENGINYFDHADIYTSGKAEEVFGKVLSERSDLREQILIQSKCGIRFADNTAPGRYDFSYHWITSSVDKILSRLGIEQLDVLQLHRPDPLMEINEVAQAFEQLTQQGKVKHFGVSNMNHHQIAFLQSALGQPIVANQIEVSLKNNAWLEQGVMVGNPDGKDINFTAGTLEYCQQHQVQIQAWGSLCQGLYTGNNLNSKDTSTVKTTELVSQLAEKHAVSGEAILLAWLMRHPANIQPIIGTTNPARIANCAQAIQVSLSREDWYRLYICARGKALP